MMTDKNIAHVFVLIDEEQKIAMITRRVYRSHSLTSRHLNKRLRAFIFYSVKSL